MDKNDGSAATGSLGSHGPGSSNDNRNTRRRVDTFFLALMTNMHEVPSKFKFHVNNAPLEILIGSITSGATSNMLVYNKPVRIHCKSGGLSARLVFETRAKCLDFEDWYKDDGITNEVGSPFCSVKTNFAVS